MAEGVTSQTADSVKMAYWLLKFSGCEETSFVVSMILGWLILWFAMIPETVVVMLEVDPTALPIRKKVVSCLAFPGLPTPCLSVSHSGKVLFFFFHAYLWLYFCPNFNFMGPVCANHLPLIAHSFIFLEEGKRTAMEVRGHLHELVLMPPHGFQSSNSHEHSLWPSGEAF